MGSLEQKTMTILITGATGQLGGSVVSHLLKKGVSPSAVSVFVRDAAKADGLKTQGISVKVGDYTDLASMVQAFQGIEKVLLVSSNDRGAVENRTAHHKNAIRAAKEAGVQHLVYTSFVRKPGHEHSAIADFQQAHLMSEQYLAASGMTYTILQNGIYAEMILAFVGDKLTETGRLLFPAGDGSANWTLREELAEAAAHVLTTKGHENRTYTLTQQESVDFKTIAQEISKALGQEISYHSPDLREFNALLTNAGVPEVFIGMLSQWGAAIAENTLNASDETLASFLGRKPTTVRQFIAEHFG
jgi:NAD(P)H dehydrogenase (quinone)